MNTAWAETLDALRDLGASESAPAACLRIAAARGAAIRRGTDPARGLAALLLAGSVEAEQKTPPDTDRLAASVSGRATSRPTGKAGTRRKVTPT